MKATQDKVKRLWQRLEESGSPSPSIASAAEEEKLEYAAKAGRERWVQDRHTKLLREAQEEEQLLSQRACEGNGEQASAH